MIVRERESEFVLIPQHNHAFISGELARNFKKDFFKSEHYFKEVITAVYEHDRGWIEPDLMPLWNDEDEVPCSFADYPLIPKLAYYKVGIDEVQKMSPYASLLCSLHYCSFFSNAEDKKVSQFLINEISRQKEIQDKIEIDRELLQQHFRLLQVCDDLSLYACLNEPGTDKENEHQWFKEGFANSQLFSKEKSQLNTQWLDEEKISVKSFPFIKEFQTKLEYKVISKTIIKEKGLKKAYSESTTQKQRLQFCI